MKSTMQYSVGGEIFDVADDRLDEFLADAYENYEDEPEEIYTFWINGAPVKVKESRLEEFYEDARKNGVNPVGTQGFEMDDGQIIHLKDEDVRQFVQARRTGQAMSRGMLKQTGIPEQYGRSSADREALADAFGAYYPEEEVNPKYLENERNLGDAIMPPKVAVDAVKGFGEGLKRSVTDFDELMEETYGDNAVTRALQGANANAGRMVHGLGETASTALGGRDTAIGRGVSSAVKGIDTEAPELETSNRYMQAADRAQREAAGTAFKYTIPGAAAVDAMGAANTTFRDTYNTAVENGASTEKALALASARSGLRVADVLTDASALKGFKNAGFLKNLIGNVALGAGFDYAGGIVDQMAEGKAAKDIDYRQPLDKEGSGVLEGAIQTGLMAAMGAAGRGIADAGKSIRDYDVKADRKAEEARVKKADSEDAARAQYDRTMSDEAAWQLEREIQDQVDAGTIPEGAKDRVKARVEGMFDSKRSLDNAELREAALMKAIGEEQTPTRVESAGLERRKVEQKMRENEYWAKRSDELAAQYGKEEAARKVAEEQAAVERKAAADEIAAGEREARQAEIEKAFGEKYDEWLKRKEKAKKGGKKFEEPAPTREEVAKQIEFDFNVENPVNTTPKVIERNVLKADGKVKIKPVAEEAKTPVDNPVEKTSNVATGDATDAGFKAWAVVRDGKPMAFETKADEQMARELFDEMVKNGKVDGRTGKRTESAAQEQTSKTKETAKVPDGKGKMVEPESLSYKSQLEKHLENIEPMRQGKSKKELSVNINDGGKIKTRAEIVEDANKDGLSFDVEYVNGKEKYKIKNKDGSFIEITKSMYEYGKYLGMKDDFGDLEWKRINGRMQDAIKREEKYDSSPVFDSSLESWIESLENRRKVISLTKEEETRLSDWKAVLEGIRYRDNMNARTGRSILGEKYDSLTKDQQKILSIKGIKDVSLGEDGVLRGAFNNGVRWKMGKDNLGWEEDTDYTPIENTSARFPDGKGRMKKQVEGGRLEAGSDGVDAVKTAAKLLGADAYNKAELEKKLAQWEANPTEANAKHREAAKLMLGKLEGAKKAEDVPVEVAEKPVEAKKTEKPVTEVSKAEDQNKSQETPEQFRDRVRGDAVLNRIDAAMKKAKTETERNALMEQFKARVNELRRLEIDDTTTGVNINYESKSQERVPDGKGRMVAKNADVETSKTDEPKVPDGKGKMVEKTYPVVEKSGEEIVVDAPDSVEAKISSMPYGVEKRRAQFDYMDAEVKKAKDEIRGKFTKGKDGKWTTNESGIEEYITIKVPSDGEFRVKNNPDGIAKLEQMANKLKSQIKDREKEVPVSSKYVRTQRGGFYETVWKEVKNDNTPNPPSISINKKGKSITEKEARKIAEHFIAEKDRPELSKVYVDNDAVVASNGRQLIVIDVPGAKRSGEEYPDWKKVVPKKTDHEAKFSTEELYAKLVQAKVVSEQDRVPLVYIFELNDGSLGVMSKVKGVAEYSTHEKMPKDARLIGTFNVDMLIDTVKTAAKIGDKEIRIGYNDAGGPILQNGNGYKNVLMPLRLEIDDTTTGVKLQDPDFKAWAAKKGRVASDGARREYDAEQVDALGKHIAKNWMKGVTFRRSENAAEVPNNARQIYSKDGNVIGWYDGAKKEVVTLPGADAGTVAHELGWHATYDHAKERAAAGDRTLLDKLNKYANDAKRIVVDPTTGQTLEQVITARYGRNGVTDQMVLLDEVGAARFTGENVAKFKDAAARRQAAQWYERAWNAVADTYKSMLSKMGWNKARLDNLNALKPKQTVQLLADEMLKGRTLGKAEKRGIDMDKAETLGGKYVRKMKDYLEPLGTLDKDAGNSVSGGIKTKMRLLPGKVQAAINEAEAFSRELEGKMKKSGVTAAELNEYMYAKAAGERNAKILARNGRLEGSAMSHADIQRVLGAYDNSSKKTALEQLSREVLQFQQNGFDERVRAGLISRSEANRLMAEEPNHVPMKSRFDAEGNHTGFDASATFGKPEWKKAEGRTNIGDGPLEWILQEYVDAKSHAAQNNARQSLLATVLAHPEMGTVKKLRPGETSGEMRKTTDKGEPNVVTVKSNGDTYRITLNGSRGELIARAMTGRGISRTPKALQKASRVWASTATEWSPTFAARNFLADTIDVFAVNTAEHGIIGGAIKNAKHEWNAIKMAKDIRGYVKTGKTNNATLREAIDAGILMGGGVRSRAFADTEAGLQTLKKDFAQGKNRAKALGKTLFGWVGTINQTAEMMNRVADYKLQRDAGKSKSEAALHAREVTVDFNQKGEYTPWTNMAYMFSNSALGSTMRLNKALFKSKYGMQLATGTFAMGLAEGFAEASNNGDDEEGKNVNEYTRASSIYFRNGKDIYRIPMHASPLSLVKYAGNCAARKMMGTLGKDKALNQIADDAIGILTQFAGIGDIGDNWKSGIAPSIIQPVFQAAFNRDFADRPIEKAVFDENMPKSHNGRTNTPEIYKAIAKASNSAGGGNEARKGSIAGFNADVSPEMIKHFAEGFGKNALRDVSNVEAVIEMISGKTEWDRRNIPVVRDYFRTASENDDRFFKAYSKYKGDVTEFQKRTSWESGEKAAYMKDRPWLYKTGSGSRTIDRLVNGYTVDGRHVMGINDLRKMEQGFARKKGGGYIKHEWSKEKVEEFKKRRLEMQRKVIDKVDR